MSRVLVALDVPTREEALGLAGRLRDEVAGFKVGLELLMAEGPAIVNGVAELGLPVFADAKLHDIPNTVGRAICRLGESGARWVTVHASGGTEMMRAAVDGLGQASAGHAGVLAVTVLTSMTKADLGAQGITRPLEDQVACLARMAAGLGVEGVVCAVSEARVVADLGLGITVVTPGIRPAGNDPGDQSRVATPAGAVRAGADLLVVGRPITRAPDPVEAARAINAEIDEAVSVT